MSGVWAATPASDTVDLIISETIKKIVVDIQVFYLLFIFLSKTLSYLAINV